MFSVELRELRERIDKFLAADDFARAVQPDSLRNAVLDYPLRGGKRLRPALLLWSCGLLGGDPEQAIPAAAAVEVYHNWTLVHDDIIDNDQTRRSQPSCHARFGRDFAILAGDIQQAWASRLLLACRETGVDADLVWQLSRKLHDDVNRGLISGEALDVAFMSTPWEELSPARIEEMLELKTGVLLRFCAEAGAMLAIGGSEASLDPRVHQLGDFAAAAGVAFQLRDDWLGLFGDETKLGKPVGSDLSERKPTLYMLETWHRLDEAGRCEIRRLLGKKSYTEAEIACVRKIVSDSGAEELVNLRANQLAQSAIAILDLFPENKYRYLLHEWTEFLLGRQS